MKKERAFSCAFVVAFLFVANVAMAGGPPQGKEASSDDSEGINQIAYHNIDGVIFIDEELIFEPHTIVAYSQGVAFAESETVDDGSGNYYFHLKIPQNDPATPEKDGCNVSDVVFFELSSTQPALWAFEIVLFTPDANEYLDLHFSTTDEKPSKDMKINEIVANYDGKGVKYAYMYCLEVVSPSDYMLSSPADWNGPLDVLPTVHTARWNDPGMLFVNLTTSAWQISPSDAVILSWKDPNGKVGGGGWVPIDRWEWGHDVSDPGPENTNMNDFPGSIPTGESLVRIQNGTDSDDCALDLQNGFPPTPPYPTFTDSTPPETNLVDELPPYMNMPDLFLNYEAQDPFDPETGASVGFGTVACWYQRDAEFPTMGQEHYRDKEGQEGQIIIGTFDLFGLADGYYQLWTIGVDAEGNQETRPTDPPNANSKGTGDAVKSWESSTVIDTAPPTSSVTGGTPPVTNDNGPWEMDYSYEDPGVGTKNTSGVKHVFLYVWTPASAGWVNTTIGELVETGDGKFDEYAFADGDGDYLFASVSMDNAGNMENLPVLRSDAEWTVKYNSQSYSIPVETGWNLISIPTNVSGNIESVLNDEGGDGATEWTVAQYYDATDADDPWKTYDKSAPGFINNLNTVNLTMGLWLKISETGDSYLTINGSRPVTTSMPLYKGWNFVGYPSWLENVTVSSALVGISYDQVQTFSPTADYNLKYVSDSEYLTPGCGYWIHVTADATWTVTG